MKGRAQLRPPLCKDQLYIPSLIPEHRMHTTPGSRSSPAKGSPNTGFGHIPTGPPTYVPLPSHRLPCQTSDPRILFCLHCRAHAKTLPGQERWGMLIPRRVLPLLTAASTDHWPSWPSPLTTTQVCPFGLKVAMDDTEQQSKARF